MDALCLLVESIDSHGINSNLVADCQRALGGINQQHSVHAMAASLLIDGKPAQQCGGDRILRMCGRN